MCIMANGDDAYEGKDYSVLQQMASVSRVRSPLTLRGDGD